jgi:glycerol-3-phosphate dehydrogenase (NAD(P)+)
VGESLVCKNTAVIGAGTFGTALAQLLAESGHRVRLWAFEPEVAQGINQKHINPFFLDDCQLDPGIIATNSMAEALEQAELILLVMPSQFFRSVVSQAAAHIPDNAILVCCSKGIEQGTGFTMGEVTGDVLPKCFHRHLCCLSGPSFAREVALGMPSAVTVAARDERTARVVQHSTATPAFRVYTSPDMAGVELGGAIKNPLAIAAGMTAGLELGYNTLAALITRGLAEMTRLAQARGGQLTTMAGLAGLGDLVLTCTGALSRNRTVGYRLARGENIQQITSSMKMVAEGVINTKTVLELAERSEVEMPITQAVYRVIYEGQPPSEALMDLMTRGLKSEID